VIKMADGGFRPAHNCQISTAKGTLVIVGVGVSTNSSDRGLLKPALEQHAACHGALPAQCLADGGFGKNDDIEWAARQGVEVFCPPTNGKAGVDPYAPRDNDGAAVAAWRARMKPARRSTRSAASRNARTPICAITGCIGSPCAARRR
jgi:hypothetical protein